MASLTYTQISRLNNYIMGSIYSMSVKVAAPPNFTQVEQVAWAWQRDYIY